MRVILGIVYFNSLKDKQNIRKTSLLNKIGKLLFHLLFIVVHITVLNHEVQRSKGYKMDLAILKYFTLPSFNSGSGILSSLIECFDYN